MAEVDATQRRSAGSAVIGKGEAGSVKSLVSTVELASSSAGSLVDFGDIPSNARLTGASTLYWDDLATTGSPTLDLGLYAIDGNITDDDDALTNGLDVTSASNGKVINDIADYGLEAWDHVNGQSSDPGGNLKVKGAVKDATTTTTGTLTLELYYTLD